MEQSKKNRSMKEIWKYAGLGAFMFFLGWVITKQMSKKKEQKAFEAGRQSAYAESNLQAGNVGDGTGTLDPTGVSGEAETDPTLEARRAY